MYHHYLFSDAPEKRPKVTWWLLKRVFAYARPYYRLILWMLLLTVAVAGLSLITPLILRDLIDRTLPDQDLQRLLFSGIALLFIPLLIAVLNVVQRYFNARVGEGVVFNLRTALFSHMQRMSLGFFTNTKVKERIEMVVLATGIVPSTVETKITAEIAYDNYGFVASPVPGIYVAGCSKRPADVVTSVRDATGAALKAIQSIIKGESNCVG